MTQKPQILTTKKATTIYMWAYRFLKIFRDLCRKFRPEIKRKLSENHLKNPKKHLPEAFPEYPEIANKPASRWEFLQDPSNHPVVSINDSARIMKEKLKSSLR